MQILVISGSARGDSWNTRLLQSILSHAPPDVEVCWAPALDTLPHFNEDIEAETCLHGSVRALVAAVTACHAVVISTPEYNQSIPGVLKNALDWLSRRADDAGLIGKPVAITGATVGPWGTRLAQAHLRHVLGVMGLRLVGRPLYVAHAARRYDIEESKWESELEAQFPLWMDGLIADVAPSLQAPARTHAA